MNRLLIAALVGLVAGSARAEMMNARIRFEPSEAISQAGRSLCLKTEVVQVRPGALVIEPNDFSVFQPANPNGRVVDAEGSLSRAAVTHMKELGWRFEITDPGEYVVWMRAWFPLAAGYNHFEKLDDGESMMVFDSVDGGKIDKFGSLPGGSAMDGKWLEPKMWHWYPNCTYKLVKGKHFLHFPPNGAWCGGCLLDRMVLVKKGGGERAELADPQGRRVVRAPVGEIVSRRIKTERIAKWTLEAEADKGDGKLEFEYSYGGETWAAFTPGEVLSPDDKTEYLYIRIRLAGVEKGLQPIVYGYRFRVEKKEKR